MKRILNLLVIAISLFGLCSAHAVIRTWNGSASGYWAWPGNWSPVSAPVDGDTLFFPTGASNKDQTNNIVGVLELGGIFIQGSGYSLGGTSVGVTNGIHAEFATGSASIELITRLDADTSFTVGTGFPAATSQLLFPMNYINLNNRTLTMSANATNSLISVAADIIDGGGLSVGNVVKMGPGTLRYTSFFNGAKSYTGTTTVKAGNLELYGTGQAINGPLTIGEDFGGFYGSEVRLFASDKISHNSVTIEQNGRLDLNGFTDSIGALVVNGGDVATGAGWLSCTSIVASVANYGTNIGDFPQISGELFIGGLLPISVSSSVSNTAPDLFINAGVTGSGGLRLLPNTGDLQLSGSNSYSGQTIIEGSKLHADNSHALGSTTVGTTLSGTNSPRLEFYADIAGEWLTNNSDFGSLWGHSQPNWSGNIVLNQSLVVNDAILSGVISGSGGLEKDINDDTVVLAGNSPNTYSGITLVRGGVLALNKTSGNAINAPVTVGPYTGSIGSPPVLRLLTSTVIAEVPVTINRNGLFDLNGFSDTIGSLTLSEGVVTTAGGTLTLQGDITSLAGSSNSFISGNIASFGAAMRTVSVADGSANLDLIIAANVTSGGIAKTGTGTLRMSGVNSYVSATLVKEGILEATSTSALGSSLGVTVVSNGATLLLKHVFDGMAETIILNGAGFGGTNGALHGESISQAFGINQIVGDIVLAAPSTIGADGDTFQIGGEISGAGPLTKIGSGKLTLNGSVANVYNGATYVNEGVLELHRPSGVTCIPQDLVIGTGPLGNPATVRHLSGASNVIGNFVQGSGNIIVNGGGLYDLNGQFEGFDGPPFGSSTPIILYDGGDAQTGSGRLTLPGSAGLYVDPGFNGSSTFSGRIGLSSGSHNFTVHSRTALSSTPELTLSAALEAITGTASLTKSGNGRMRVSGNNTFTGVMNVNDGRVTLANANAAGAAGGGVNVNNDAELEIDGSLLIDGEPLILNTTNSSALSALVGNSTWDSTIALNKDANIDVSSGASLRVLNALSGNAALIKSGLGTLALGGATANSYTNATIVNAGTLVLSNTALNLTVLGPLIIGDGSGGANADVVRFGRDRQIANRQPVTINSSGLLDLDGFSESFGKTAFQCAFCPSVAIRVQRNALYPQPIAPLLEFGRPITRSDRT